MSENIFNQSFSIVLSKNHCDDKCNKYCKSVNHSTTCKKNNRTKFTKNVVKLNIIEPDDNMVTKTEFVCEKCKICYFARNSLWYHRKKCKGENNLFIKHDTCIKKEITLENNLDVILLDNKNMKSIEPNMTIIEQKMAFIEPKVKVLEPNVFVCNNCEKQYALKNSLWYHRKKCVSTVTKHKINLGKTLEIIEQDITPIFSVCNSVTENNKTLLEPKQITLEQKLFTCKKCNKGYTSKNSLWYHRKKCLDELNNTNIKNAVKVVNDTNIQNFSELLTKLVSQNNEFMQQIVELQKNNGNNNSTNNSNLNVFLNETCKDAINLTDFVDSLVLGINDLEETSRLGYAKGISKIFINGLNKLDVCKRPLHCSDLKRNTIYIKDDNQWTKENNDKQSLTKAIKQVSHKNIKNIFEWQKMNPSYNDSNSKQNDRYNKIICESMSGSSKEEQMDNYDKIIKNITKEIVIDKIV
jgi:hypothetical protein